MTRLLTLLLALASISACEGAPPEPEPPRKGPPAKPPPQSGAIDLGGRPDAGRAIEQKPVVTAPTPAPAQAKPTAPGVASPDDPLGGKLSLADATKGLVGKGPLVAEIRTAKGKLDCELFEDKAPITVANFVGLARGLRPFKGPDGTWAKKNAYDGTTFHRVVKGFMIQGGDPAGTGAGDPGYVIPDEIWEGARHDQRGLLCMANRGKNTNGMQFFILDGPAAHLDGGYTIFGKCGPEAVIEALASVPVRGDRALDPPKIEKVVIRRAAAKKK
jgi:peptidyl-prolyl cis-trans isomerase A (cyclophilin A)